MLGLMQWISGVRWNLSTTWAATTAQSDRTQQCSKFVFSVKTTTSFISLYHSAPQTGVLHCTRKLEFESRSKLNMNVQTFPFVRSVKNMRVLKFNPKFGILFRRIFECFLALESAINQQSRNAATVITKALPPNYNHFYRNTNFMAARVHSHGGKFHG